MRPSPKRKSAVVVESIAIVDRLRRLLRLYALSHFDLAYPLRSYTQKIYLEVITNLLLTASGLFLAPRLLAC